MPVLGFEPIVALISPKKLARSTSRPIGPLFTSTVCHKLSTESTMLNHNSKINPLILFGTVVSVQINIVI